MLIFGRSAHCSLWHAAALAQDQGHSLAGLISKITLSQNECFQTSPELHAPQFYPANFYWRPSMSFLIPMCVSMEKSNGKKKRAFKKEETLEDSERC